MGKAELKLKPLAEHPQYVEAARKLAGLEERLRAAEALLAKPVTREDKQAAIDRDARRLLLDTDAIIRNDEGAAARQRDEQERAEAQAAVPVLKRAIELGSQELEQLAETCSREIAVSAEQWFGECIKRLADALVAAYRAAERFRADCEDLRASFDRCGLARSSLPRGAFCDQYTVTTAAGREEIESILQRSPREILRRLIEAKAVPANGYRDL
jgi:hypothetical protein